MKSEHGVLDIPRESNQRQRRMRMIIYCVVGIAAIAGITIFLARLKPALPVVDKTTIWVDAVKKGPMVIAVKGLGVFAPKTKGAKAPSNSTTVQLKIPRRRARTCEPAKRRLSTHTTELFPVMWRASRPSRSRG